MLTSTKSVSFSGKSYGFQRNYRTSSVYTHTGQKYPFGTEIYTVWVTWFGLGGQLLKLLVRLPAGRGEKGVWTTEGRMR